MRIPSQLQEDLIAVPPEANVYDVMELMTGKLFSLWWQVNIAERQNLKFYTCLEARHKASKLVGHYYPRLNVTSG
jgi:hypothetical protein